MPMLKLGSHSDARTKVVAALEAVSGMPSGSTGGGAEWIKQLVGVINDRNLTEIVYSGEDYGYMFTYTTPKSALLLADIKKKYTL